MSPRETLHHRLESILGSSNVYFQPPPSLLMEYPCIVYDIQCRDHLHANNARYAIFDTYSVTLIDYDPESAFVEPLDAMPYTKFNRKYKSDRLNHFVFDVHIQCTSEE